ncbi:hypothetical protein GCM10008932_01730 [Alkalibacterium iburiense]|uniref:Peptidoglycan hydrolase n=1 Tax=Alkalibacterium iburiense TaxID=290589 RepID=A0ABP3GUY5_9LACT
MSKQKYMPLQPSFQKRRMSKPVSISASLLAGIVATSGFSQAVNAEELNINQEELHQLHEQYTALEASMEDAKQDESNELNEEKEPVLSDEEAEELEYIKAQLVKMIELAGGQEILDQLSQHSLSYNQLDTIFNALLENQVETPVAVSNLDTEDTPEAEEALEEESESLVSEEITEEELLTEETLSSLSEDIQEDSDSEEDTSSLLSDPSIEGEEVQETEDIVSEEDDTLQEDSEQDQEVVVQEDLELDQVVGAQEESEEEDSSDEIVDEVTNDEEPVDETEATEPEEPEQVEEEAPKEEPKKETPKETPKEEPKKETPKEDAAKAIVYVVKSGDTLNRIAQQYGTTASKIASLNNIQNVNRISVGQVLAINEAGVSQAGKTQPSTPGDLHNAKTPQGFINQISGFAQEIAAEHNLYASVMIAQAILESGYGGSSLSAPPNHNLFGIKGSYNGQSVAMRTREYYSHTGWITITDNFKKYPSYEESLRDYAGLLRRGTSWNPQFYSGTWIENTSSYKDATQWLQGRYATDPTYANKLNNIISLYNLTRFDVPRDGTTKPVPNPAPKPETTPPTTTPSKPVGETTTYTVVRGDTLSKIAREFKTTVQALKIANNLKSDLIFVNQRLTVPKLETQPKPETPKPVEPAPEQSKPETPKPETQKPDVPVDEEKTNPIAQTYTVVRGDTLSHIARRFNTTVGELRKLNNLTGDLIFVNQRLTVPGTVEVETPAPQPEDKPDTSVHNGKQTTHTVKSGETLSHLAVQYKTTVNRIKELNTLTSDLIRVGQQLRVPEVAGETAKPVETKPEETSVAEGTYTVVRGDTLSKIARDYKTTVAKLKADNKLTGDTIFVGQRLIVANAKTEPSVEVSKPVETPKTAGEYIVVAGDTLSRIAREHNTTVTQIRTDNNLTSDLIRIGQRLTVANAKAEPSVEAPKPVETPKVTGEYVVVAGDTLSHIARRHNTTVTQIRTDNNLTSDLIRIGQRLIVANAKAAPSVETSKPVEAPKTTGEYVVVAGDTLSRIAREHNTTVTQIRTDNNLTSDLIRIGQRLTVANAKSEPTVTTPKPVETPKPEETVKSTGEYVVVAGDTLSHIARRHNTTVSQIRTDNNLTSDVIRIGQRLTVANAKSEPTVPAPKPVETPKPEETVKTSGEYVVVAGDTLSQIARRHSTTVAQLMKDNNLSSDIIFVNQRLVVSGIKSESTVTTPKPVETPKTSGEYIVMAGDTLSHIARRHNTTVSQIRTDNNLRSDLIFVGQRLVVSSGEVGTSSSTKTPASAGHSTKLHVPATGRVTSRFGMRLHPIHGVYTMHNGIDIAGSGPVTAADSGIVTTVAVSPGLGNYIRIDHGNGYETLYAHLQPNIVVSRGQRVSRGQVIGTMGATGTATGVHLHLELRKNGNLINPAPYLGL